LKETITIRTATPEDAAALVAIYAPYVEKTAISFEYETPSVEEFAGRIRHTLEFYPYLVAEIDGRPVGYAYASPFIRRPAYDWSAELSIYVGWEERGKGVGRRLYEEMERALKKMHVLNVNTCIAWIETPDEYLDRNSPDFHAHMGYRLVGKFTNSGYKFGRWYDMIWMEKLLGQHPDTPEKVVAFSSIEKDR
jgi:phosphinothricin acetyltransferase